MVGEEAAPIADETIEVEEEGHHHATSWKEEALDGEASAEVGCY
jgi:hypothetical protein